MIGVRNLMIAGGALVAAGAGAIGLRYAGDDGPPPEIDAGAEADICLKQSLGFLKAEPPRCVSRRQLAALRGAALKGPDESAVAVEMTHPSDATAPTRMGRTCRDYDDLRFEGWFALSSREQRREAYFKRACGALDMLMEAKPSKISYFADGSPTLGEVASLAADDVMRFGPEDGAEPGDPEIDQPAAARWRIRASGRTIVIDEIANADFDEDGVEEILAFIAFGPDDATARAYSVVLLEKDKAGAALSATPIDAAARSKRNAAG